MVKEIRNRMPKLGTRKLYEKLRSRLKPLGVGRDRLFDIMRANHMQIVPKRGYHVTTNSHHRFRKHKNLVEYLQVNRPEQVWVADITYVGDRQCPMYLSLVTDAYSKKIMGFNLSNSLNSSGAISAMEMALKNRKYTKKELIHHSDRGVQYCGNDYQNLLKKNRVKCRMTEKYDPYQNAIAERVNGIIKQEFLEGIIVRDIKLMGKIIKDSVSIYNNERPHLSCHMLTPKRMHQQKNLTPKNYKTKKSTEETPVLSQ